MTLLAATITLDEARHRKAAGPEGWPQPLADEAYHGLVGRIIRALEPHTEADQAALMFQLLVAFGSAVGRGPHFLAEDDRHGMNLFVACVGETAKGRKGTSWGRVRNIVESADPDWAKRISGGPIIRRGRDLGGERSH